MKRVKLLLIISLVIICCGCDGNVTRDIRHAGFSIDGNKFVCDDLVPEDEDDQVYEKIKYFKGSYAITEKGEIYDISMSLKYSNNQNCKKANTNLIITSVFDEVGRASDGNYYYLTTQNNGAAYTAVASNDNALALYKLLLDDTNNIKVQAVDNGTGSYYVLKKDGNIYNYIVARENSNSSYNVLSSTVIYNAGSVDGKIIDFGYYGDSLNTFIKTEDAVYRMKITNAEKCKKYADVACKYELQEEEVFETYKDKILTFNGSTLITTYGKTFSVAS